MSIYSTAVSGTKMFRNRFNKGYRHLFDAEYGRIYPAFSRFCLPGDVWKPGANLLIRYQPTMAPPLTRAWARMRYFFVPLRLVEPEIEKIITGSDNGKLIETSLPKCENVFARTNNKVIHKWDLLDSFGFPVGDYSSFSNDECLPAAYWVKGYFRCWFDYYRDENLSSFSDFDTSLNNVLTHISDYQPLSICLHKDYFTSATPWQLKGIAPTFNINVSNPFQNAIIPFSASSPIPDGTTIPAGKTVSTKQTSQKGDAITSYPTYEYEWTFHKTPGDQSDRYYTGINAADLNSAFNGVAGSFTAADLREMFAQTRIFERLARCGSRYTEYLHSNFGIAPADDTLQRAQYLGGFKQPIVTTEVVSTADSSNPSGSVKYPVGTLRGHGISNGGNMCKPFVCKEFGMIFGLLDIMPELQYTQGIEKEYTYKSRWDFFNPSFQNLSEQEIRNGEVFIASDGKNDETFGFTGIYNELRTSRDIVSGDLRDNLSYWTQALNFTNRPNLNSTFIEAISHKESFTRPFVVTDTSVSKPIIVDCYNFGDVYRPMVKHSVPGLIDHN